MNPPRPIREPEEFERIHKFIEDAEMNASVSRISDGNYLAWKVKIVSPLGSIRDREPNKSQVESTIMVEFTADYPFRPPILYCTDSVNYPFLGEGNRIPFTRLKNDFTWEVWIPMALIIAGVHDLFLSHLCTYPEENKVSKPRILKKKPDFDMKIPETAIDKYLEHCEVGVNRKVRECFKLYEKQEELQEVQKEMDELKEAKRKLRKRRKKLEKAVEKRRRLAQRDEE